MVSPDDARHGLILELIEVVAPVSSTQLVVNSELLQAINEKLLKC